MYFACGKQGVYLLYCRFPRKRITEHAYRQVKGVHTALLIHVQRDFTIVGLLNLWVAALLDIWKYPIYAIAKNDHNQRPDCNQDDSFCRTFNWCPMTIGELNSIFVIVSHNSWLKQCGFLDWISIFCLTSSLLLSGFACLLCRFNLCDWHRM